MAKKVAVDRKARLVAAAEDLENTIGFTPPIKTKGKTEDELEKIIHEAAAELDPTDKISEQTAEVLAELGIKFAPVAAEEAEEEEEEVEEETEEEVEEAPVVTKKAPAKTAPAKKEAEKKASAPAAEKKVAEKKAAEPKAKKEGPPPIASVLDGIIQEGGSWEEVVKAANAAATERGATAKYTKGTLSGHINYRMKSNANWLKEHKLTLTDDGIQKGK